MGCNPPIKINLSNPCNPCNPCEHCNRCACECTCALPDYCEDGCIILTPSACIKYNGDPIESLGITVGMTLNEVIDILANNAPEEETFNRMSAPEDEDPEDISIDASIQSLSDRITMSEERLNQEDENLQTQINNNIGLNEVTIINSDAVIGNYENNNLNLNFDYNIFLNNFSSFIQNSENNTSIFGQLIHYINNPINFINAPFEVFSIPSITTTLIQWTTISEANTYEVYKRPYALGNFEKVATTPSIAITISGLLSNSLYEFYILSVDASGNKSIPSKIIKVQTLSQIE